MSDRIVVSTKLSVSDNAKLRELAIRQGTCRNAILKGLVKQFIAQNGSAKTA